MTKKVKTKTILAACLFILVLTGCRFIWFYHYNSSDHPEAEQGILDLRNWDGLERETISLDGEWKDLVTVTSGQEALIHLNRRNGI
ncbi:hypothetical protein [Siminovitchia fordii]|uniref:Uncharacterized protein n=1 Tax=Siminovitchia fordii TaxID=254759 RepID=A0ABQ4K549_9BACI|nr:hypothetical protein [Siminovitchia fordii]GIN20844.1 hypothetical protein J1TS3_19780 [Siminovitchia fordii]